MDDEISKLNKDDTPTPLAEAIATAVEEVIATTAEEEIARAEESKQITDEPVPFDFAEHERSAISDYLNEYDFYKVLASVVGRVIEECLSKRVIKVLSVQQRAKDPKSFGRKASTPSDIDPNAPKYANPLEEITDLAGVRVITFFPETVEAIDGLIS